MIKFIYFDVGGVVIRDFSGTAKWAQLKTELGITAEMDAEFMKMWLSYEQEVVTGSDLEAFIPVLRKKFNLNIPEEYSLLNGFVSRFQANKPIWDILDKAKRKNRIGLLTNMYAGMLSEINKKGILPSIGWDVVVDSSIELLKKPDTKFFELAETMASTHGREILFIDNTATHVSEAKSFGWQAYHYDSSDYQDSSKKLEEFLFTLGVI